VTAIYLCNGKPRPAPDATHWAQDGWFDDPHGMTRKPKMVPIKNVFDCAACAYDKSASDPKCDGCQWRK